MATIQEKLRDNWLDANYEAADTIDALVAALEEARPLIVSEWHDEHRVVKQIDAALALARKGGE